MKALGILTVTALVLAASAGATVGGLRGVVTRGPISPVCVVGEPCSAPAKGVLVTFARGSVTRSVTTDSRGRYRVSLSAGTWTIRIARARFGYQPRSVRVPTGAFAVRNIQIDTGIR